MPRYVDLDKLPLVAIDVDTINGAAFVDLREVQQALRQAEAQTGEVAPVVHGRWAELKEHIYLADGVCKEWVNFYCSECDAPNNSPTDYCPCCGATMDGEKIQ